MVSSGVVVVEVVGVGGGMSDGVKLGEGDLVPITLAELLKLPTEKLTRFVAVWERMWVAVSASVTVAVGVVVRRIVFEVVVATVAVRGFEDVFGRECVCGWVEVGMDGVN